VERILIEAGAALVIFALGKRYGARVEEEAVEVALYTFTRAKAALVKVSNTALVDIKNKEARLVERIAKYL
jgi:hypothetical protein